MLYAKTNLVAMSPTDVEVLHWLSVNGRRTKLETTTAGELGRLAN